MKKLSLREKSGDWIYYLTSFTYKEVKENVKRVDDELHKSKSLNELIQRSLTDNVNSIARYIENQKEHFFNALVLAVYDGDPQWHEVELDYGEGEKYEMGILELTGEEKIFPVDGQHRVEGIKKVLSCENGTNYEDETIPVILIGHKNTTVGMQRTRRLFSTLNRYAKPVSLNDIIALDEDDIVAIVTRHLIENCDLFKEKRLNNHKQKAIPEKDKTAFTNIISLYECNTELLKYFIKDLQIKVDNRVLTGKKKIEEYCRKRPLEEDITKFINFVDDYWASFSSKITPINEYLQKDLDADPVTSFRNKEGGNLIFRPIGQRPFVLCALSLYEIYNDFELVMAKMNLINYDLNNEIWKFIAWNPISKKMIASSNGRLIELMLKYFVGIELGTKDYEAMIKSYIGMKGDEQLTPQMAHNQLNEYRVTT